MKSDDKNKLSIIEVIQYRLGADKKKTVMALCLIGVMAVMWGRVLMKKGPESAQSADVTSDGKSSQESDLKLNIDFVKLPIVEGRNDEIARDFFAPNGWRNFVGGGGSEDTTDINGSGNAIQSDSVEEIKAKIKIALQLQAVWVGDVPKASVNGKQVVTGDILQINDGVNQYNCEVVKIEENKMYVSCGKVQVILKCREY